ncbi:hypothetical protein MMAD_18760 [Mycolicibacterium madagascariense]|uniref:EamA-like transporter family protein n=1 Tax=Mycolicibacterium madagascariense TaxID=212765 RepID=A0A7I7XEJ5_9MYCO|nr:DMT family transporter [Mycolicibacterium madagascariense]MCV7015287.1 DMT family transporter [Mycolicibacterium madagascariense]BBZ27581.1 hypothetical protein MMAD_18760 [Mycolicibacterium madagascariense]
MTASLLYPFILVAGVLQALGNSMNARLRDRLVNPWLAATASFLPVVFLFATLFIALPTPLPNAESIRGMHWYSALGGVAGAVAVFGGLLFVDRVGAGPFNGLAITGNILTSLAMDAFGVFGLHRSGFKAMSWLGGLLMVVGVVLVARSSGTRSQDRGGGLGATALYPFILVAGACQALGAVLNAELRGALVNPWLASTASFLPVTFIMALMFILRPTPLPRRDDVEGVRWWMPLAGIAGGVAVFAGLLLVDKVGAGAFNGLLITANLLASIILDHFGWLGMKKVRAGPQRLMGAAVMIAGILLISVT